MRRSTHVIVGAGAAALLEMWYCRTTGRPVEFLNVLLAASAGALGAMAPDVLEPALHPNHRSLCHGGVAVYGAGRGLAAMLSASSQDGRSSALLRGLLVGYGSHLMLDATTPKGLPLLG